MEALWFLAGFLAFPLVAWFVLVCYILATDDPIIPPRAGKAL